MRRTLLAACAAAHLAACAEGDGGSTVTVRDSAGVRIVETSEPELRAGSWKLAPEPRLSIGVVEGAPEYQFTRIQGVGRLPDGGYWVAQLNNPPQIRIFDGEGGHVRSIGREGQGPGELGGIAWADRVGPDTLRVYDFWSSRFTYFSPDGEVLREIPIATLGGRIARGLSAQPGFAGGDILARSNYLVPRDAPKGENRSTTFLLRVAPTGELVDSFPPVPVTEYIGLADRNIVLPFARHTAMLPHDSLLYIATGDAYEVQAWGPGGRLVAVYRHAAERRPITPDLVDALREQRLAGARDDDARRRVEQNFSEAPMPERVPAYSREMLVDDAGNIWVEQYLAPGDTARVWDVFDAGGRYVTAVTVPRPFEVKQVTDDEAIGIWTDDLDVETVRVYELRR